MRKYGILLVYKKIDRPFDTTKMDRNSVDRYYGANAGSADAVEAKLKEMGADYIVLESDIVPLIPMGKLIQPEVF